MRSAVRSAGHPTLGEVEAVVLETDGAFSVVARRGEDSAGASSLAGLDRPAQHREDGGGA